jgi:hypothetical protein
MLVGIGGTLSSYAWTCLILNFLQTRDPPVLPALHLLPHKTYIANDGTESGFSDDLYALGNFSSKNKETIGELLFHFFRLYAHELDYEQYVISVRNGKRLTRKEKGWDHTSKEGQWRLCIEEPFNITRNLGNSADSTAFRGIHLELRRAFDLIVDGGQLDKCCEQYQYPPEEKGIFKKPITGPKPVLSAIPIQPARAGRGGANSRNSRHNNNNGQRNGAGFRRSSSGASFGRSQYSPFVQSPPLGVVGQDYLSATIQEQLLHQSNYYGLQIQQLKERMAFQQSQIQAAAHAHSVVQGSNQSSRDASATVSPQKTPYMTGGSSPRMTNAAFYPEFLSYPYEAQHMAPSMSQDGSRTNPSSPSLSTTTPARRTMQRSSLANDGSVRSQSQPPRGGVTPTLVYSPYGHFLPGYSVPYGYALPNSVQDHAQAQSSVDVPAGYDPLSRTTSLPTRDSSPKEYVGYYVSGPQQMDSKLPLQPVQVPSFGNLPQIPQYSELAHRRNRPSQELHLSLNAGRRVSRSPSPLGHHRTFSTPMRGSTVPLRSAPLPIPSVKSDRMDSTSHIHDPSFAAPSGLLIVNGSSYPSSTVENRSNPSEEDFSMDEPLAALTGREEAFRQEENAGMSGRRLSLLESPLSNRHPSPPMFPATNGFSYHPPAFENESSFSSPLQPFPSFDPVLPPSRTDDDIVLSPRSVQQPAWRGQQTTKPLVPQIDTSKGQDSSKQSEPKTAPLLSPVYETRTPSPTAHRRRSEHIRNSSLNGIFPPMNGGSAKENGLANGRTNIPRSTGVPPTPTGKATTASSPLSGEKQAHNKTPSTATSTTSGWQQNSKGKKKKNRQRSQSGAAVSGSSNSKRPEPMPVNESERKGG